MQWSAEAGPLLRVLFIWDGAMSHRAGRARISPLIMLSGVVKQMAGFIWAYSEVGHGTTFRLYFPVTTEAGSVRDEPVHSVERHGAATISCH